MRGFNGSTDTKAVACELTEKDVLEATGSTGKSIIEASGVNGKVVGSCVVKGRKSLDKGEANAMIGCDRSDVNCLVNRVITKVGEDRVVMEKDQVNETYILQRKASGGKGVIAMASCYGSTDTKKVGFEANDSNGIVVIEDSGSNGFVVESCGVNKDSCVGKGGSLSLFSMLGFCSMLAWWPGCLFFFRLSWLDE
ncbi:hypothetical protein QYF36_007333 [Acer negundo]|nr:hypothetical protein QYF36_007333 [Acer negundo]